jgi:hypothetical protein
VCVLWQVRLVLDAAMHPALAMLRRASAAAASAGPAGQATPVAAAAAPLAVLRASARLLQVCTTALLSSI